MQDYYPYAVMAVCLQYLALLSYTHGATVWTRLVLTAVLHIAALMVAFYAGVRR